MPGYFNQTSSNSHTPMMQVNQSVVGASCASVGFAPQQRDSDPETDMERAPDRSAADGGRNVEVNEIYRFLSEKAARALSD